MKTVMDMKSKVTITLLLDKRTKLKNGTFPVRIRVYYNGIRRYYELDSIEIDAIITKRAFTEEEFMMIKLDESRTLKKYKYIFSKVEEKFEELAASIRPFNFTLFEEQLINVKDDIETDLIQFLRNQEQYLKDNNRHNYAATIKTTYKHLEEYFEPDKKKRKEKIPRLLFQEVTTSFLNNFEEWLMKVQNVKSVNTIGIYMRNIRTACNIAVSNKVINRDAYPFGKNKYKIPKLRKETIKALTQEDVEKIANCDILDEGMQWARDMWIFSFLCNGMNINDIAYLKYSDINKKTLTFVRQKTKNTTKSNQITIQLELDKLAIDIIKRWGNKSKKSFIFPILTEEMDFATKALMIRNLNSYISKKIKIIAKSLKIDKSISTIYARHTFATICRNNGISIEVISKALGHTNISTTINYLGKLDEQNLNKISSVIANTIRKT